MNYRSEIDGLRAVAVLPVIVPEDHLCPEGICDMQKGDVFMYRDEGHLTVEGWALLGRQMGLAGRMRSTAAET